MPLSMDEAVLQLRRQPEWAAFVRSAYLDDDLPAAGKRFQASAEFAAVVQAVGQTGLGRVLDLGAGNGIASYALAQAGARHVLAVEPDPSPLVGLGAIRRLTTGLPVGLIQAVGEDIPLGGGLCDVVYARQVLHHTRDLPRVLRECARVLRSGGRFIACREHVVDDDGQLRAFLAAHPVHALTQGENAFSGSTYIKAIQEAGLRLERVWGPWDSIINAFPAATSPDDLAHFPERALARRFGTAGAMAGRLPPVRWLVWRWLRRPTPGRLYTFVASKSAQPA